MSINLTIRPLAACCALALGLAAAPAVHAVSAGDVLVRVGVGHVAPNDKSTELTGSPGGKVAVDSATTLALNFTYMMSDNIGLELLGSLPFKHDINGAGALSGVGKVADTRQLPPTLILLYNFAPKAAVRPYAGVGVNYTIFFDEKTTGALAGTDIKLDNSVGLAAEVGVDVDLNKSMYLNASLWRMAIDTKATTALGTTKVTVDPWAVFLGVGWKF